MKRTVLTEDQAGLLYRGLTGYYRVQDRIFSELAWQWGDAAREELRKHLATISELMYVLVGEDEDYEYRRITLEFNDEPFPDVTLRSEE